MQSNACANRLNTARGFSRNARKRSRRGTIGRTKSRAVMWLFFAVMLAIAAVVIYLGWFVVESEMPIENDASYASETVYDPSTIRIVYDVPLESSYQAFVRDAVADTPIPASIVFAIMERESNYNPDLIGDNGNSYGIMQIYESAHHDRCVRLGCDNLLSQYQCVTVAVDYLRELLDTGKDWEWILTAYTGGASYAARVGGKSEYADSVLGISERIEKTAHVEE